MTACATVTRLSQFLIQVFRCFMKFGYFFLLTLTAESKRVLKEKPSSKESKKQCKLRPTENVNIFSIVAKILSLCWALKIPSNQWNQLITFYIICYILYYFNLPYSCFIVLIETCNNAIILFCLSRNNWGQSL